MPEIKRHRWHIAPREHERHVSRRGRRHAYERIEPTRTALVVIDLVPFFVAEHPYARGVIAPINALAAQLRRAGGVVAWVVPSADMPASEEFFGTSIAERYGASGGAGAIRDRLALDVGWADVDVFVEKSAPSAFFPGRCDLDAVLQERSVDTVLIAGTVANVCCESSARDASTLGYRVVMIADAIAANDDAELNATLRTIYRSFGDVRPGSEIVGLIEAGGADRA